MRAARCALLRVVHRRVDPYFLDRLRRGTGKSVADCQVDRSTRLNDAAGAAVANACAGRYPRRGDLAGALAIEEVAAVHTIQLKAVRCVALAVGPDRRIAQSAVRARAAGQLRVHARRKNGHAGKAACR